MAQKTWRPSGVLWLIVAATSAVSVGAQSDAWTGCEGLLGVRSTAGYLHAWSRTVELREMEEACWSTDMAPFYWQMRASAENLLGNHRVALVDFDRVRPGSRRADDAELPSETRSVAALAYITEQAMNLAQLEAERLVSEYAPHNH